MSHHQIQIDAEKCIGCGLCQRDCPASNLSIVDKKAVVQTQSCLMCGHCVAICPRAAVTISGYDEPTVELVQPSALDLKLLRRALKARRSIRQFTSQPVAQEQIAQIIEAGRLTPTGGNAQDVSYVVLQQNIGRYEELAVKLFRRLMPLAKLVSPMAKRVEVDPHFFFKKAPVALVVVSKSQINGSLAAANMALMAESCGLGVLYSGFFTMAANRSRPLRKALGLTRRDKAVTTLVLGHSAVTYRRTAQREAAAVRRL